MVPKKLILEKIFGPKKFELEKWHKKLDAGENFTNWKKFERSIKNLVSEKKIIESEKVGVKKIV